MKCIICHSEDIVSEEVREEFKYENDIIYVPMKVETCQSCGERYYTRHDMQVIEGIEKQIKDKSLKLKEIGKILLAS
jgi:YgiT-type zinc finger domain-containing protein